MNSSESPSRKFQSKWRLQLGKFPLWVIKIQERKNKCKNIAKLWNAVSRQSRKVTPFFSRKRRKQHGTEICMVGRGGLLTYWQRALLCQLWPLGCKCWWRGRQIILISRGEQPSYTKSVWGLFRNKTGSLPHHLESGLLHSRLCGLQLLLLLV